MNDKELLKRTLRETFNFPVQFTRNPHEELDVISRRLNAQPTETTSRRPWTFISGESASAFSRTGLTSSCHINLESLIAFLRSHNVNSLKIWVFFEDTPDDVR